MKDFSHLAHGLSLTSKHVHFRSTMIVAIGCILVYIKTNFYQQGGQFHGWYIILEAFFLSFVTFAYEENIVVYIHLSVHTYIYIPEEAKKHTPYKFNTRVKKQLSSLVYNVIYDKRYSSRFD
jgi:hypothetical protein